MNITFSADNKYAQFLGVTLCSIFENKRGSYNINIYVLDGGIEKENKEKLKSLVSKYSENIHFIKIDNSFFKDFYISGHITHATYYRILIPKLLQDLDKILYLDCDIIVLKDIFELYNINIDNYLFAAVNEGVLDRQKELRMPENEPYFNAGVMLMNLKRWREENISEKIIQFIKDNPKKLKNWDQDALNATMYGKWLNLNIKFNYTKLLREKNKLQQKEIKDNVSVIHYTNLKPWNYLCMDPLKYKYFLYLEKTDWKTIKIIDKNLKNILIKFLEKFALFLFSEKTILLIKKIKNFLGIKFY